VPPTALAPSDEIEPYSKHPSELRPYEVCPPPTKGHVSCLAIGAPDPAKLQAAGQPLPTYEGSGVSGGFSPSDLRSAYGLPSEGGEGKTVAITIAYDDPTAEEDLATYRSYYGLSSCTTANGCFQKVNQKGEAKNYPEPDAGWALETSLDLDMVSAICPQCHILLVEADRNELEDLGPAVEKAAGLGADAISNSWATEEFSGEDSFNSYFDHPGIPTLFATGDWGYGVYYPAASPDVVAVGGTSLKKDKSSRGWAETAWSGTGSGCSAYQEKPTWQDDDGCAKRTVSDVAAVSDPQTPVSVYASYGGSGWSLVGGTSAATPILAGVEALSSGEARAAGPAAFARVGRAGELFDPSDGENGVCANYLCHGEAGYDGPTGWGTPDGPLKLPVAITEGVTVASSGKATLHGAVNPKGLKTEYRFEYGTTTSYGNSVPVPDKSAGTGTEYLGVDESVEGLKGQTTYHYRITATNAEGAFHGVDRAFGTTPPTVTTNAASDAHVYRAKLNATVNPEGGPTNYYFEYGKTNSYGVKAPATATAVGSGTKGVEVSAQAKFLDADQSYHFRVVAENNAGVSYGEDRTLSTAPADWAMHNLPQPANSGEGEEGFGVDCMQPDECIAVGDNWDLGVHTSVTLAELWNGEFWSPMTTPNPPGLEEGWMFNRFAVLYGVSCASASNCVAVGAFRDSSETLDPLAEHWDGSEWTLLPIAAPSGAVETRLYDVSCASSTYCTAVGSFRTSSNPAAVLVEHWDGSEWTIQSMPKPSDGVAARLFGVSCASSTACMAVGYTEGGSEGNKQLIEHWDGSEWTQPTMPSGTAVESPSTLSDVSCVSSTLCTAVGSQRYPTGGSYTSLAEHWNGSEWAVQPTPPLNRSSLVDVSCTSSIACTAVGNYRGMSLDEVGYRTYGVRWDGTAWTALEVPSIPAAAGWSSESFLQSVSCSADSVCTGVGSGLTAPTGQVASYFAFSVQALRRPKVSGQAAVNVKATRATLRAKVNPSGLATNYYFEYGKSTAYGQKSPATEGAIGFGTVDVSLEQSLEGLEEGTTYHFRVVAENADGITRGEDKTFVPAANDWRLQPFSSSGALNGISCPSDSACVAVGDGPLAQTFDGKTWTSVGLPTPAGTTWSDLTSVSCASASSCLAVGQYTTAGSEQLLFSGRYSGEKWTLVPMPVPAEDEWAGMGGVSCVSSTFCIAAGRSAKLGEKGVILEHPLTEIFDGETWTILKTPEPSGVGRTAPLTDVACVSISSCVAVGYFDAGSHLYAEKFDGKKWTAQSVPGPAGSFNGTLNGVSCAYATDCIAVGQYDNSSKLLAVHFDGTEWSAQTMPNPLAGEMNSLASVSCVSTSDCIAVGETSKEWPVREVVTARWDGEAWSLETADDPTEGKVSSSGAMLRDVSCSSASKCAAVGWRSGSAGPIALIERYRVATAETEAATAVKVTLATLNAKVNPEGSATSYYFEYGKTTSYGTKIPSSAKEAGSGTSDVSVSQTLAGLSENTTYHYRVVAESTGGATVGEDKTLRTGERPAPFFSSSFGSEGSGNGQFDHPTDVAISPKGDLWVSDLSNNRVEKFNQAGEYLAQFGTQGSGNGQLNAPIALAVEASGNVWVLDAANNRAEEFNEAGEYLRSAGSAGTGPGQFAGSGPEGMALDSQGNLWVADTNGDRIEEFDEKGEYLKSVGSGHLTRPAGIDIGPGDGLWVADRQTNKIVKFNQAGEYLGQFGTQGTGEGQFDGPEAVTVDSEGDVWVGDRGNNRIEEFNEAGEYLDQFGATGSGAGQFNFTSIFGIATDSKGDLWVTDGNNRVQRWLHE
jgi:sugar lactone lactonase YvrE